LKFFFTERTAAATAPPTSPKQQAEPLSVLFM
jgi:hypothetical protein